MIALIVYLAYLSLAIELIFFPVPSVASSYNLWSEKEDYAKEVKDAKIDMANWSLPKKVIFLALPIVIISLTFILPLLYASGLLVPDSIFQWMQESKMKTIVMILSFAFILGGRALTFYSVMKIRRDNAQAGESFDLKNTSIYSKSRNPIQLGMYLFAFGLILLYPVPLFIIGLVFYVLYMDYKIKIEEKFLKEKFGEAYQKYSLSTKRYI